VEQPDAPQSAPLAEHSLKPPEALSREELEVLVEWGVQAAHSRATMLPEALPLGAQEQPEPLEAQ
jgi:hypothetical protein